MVNYTGQEQRYRPAPAGQEQRYRPAPKVSDVRKKSKDDKTATAARKSYKKDGYTYTESAPGSNKFQNFGAAKPVEKKPAVKAKTVTKPKPKPAAKTAVRGQEKRFPSAEDRKMATVGQEQRYRPAAVTSGRGQEQRYRPAPKAKGVSGSDAKGKRGVGVRLLKYFGYTAGTKTIK